VSSDEPPEGTGADSSERADRSLPEESPEPGPVAPDEGGATPYTGYGSPGGHSIPLPPKPPPVPDGPAEQAAPPGDTTAPPPPGGPTAPPPPQAYHGPAYPGETYPVYPPGQPVHPGQPTYPPGQPVYPGQPASPPGQPVYPGQPASPPGQPVYPGQPAYPGQPVYPGYPGAVASTARPGQVTAGVIMAWVGGGVFALLGLLLFALAANADLLDGVEQQLDHQINRDQATAIFRALGVGLGIWGIAVIVFAALAWNGKNWARIVLTVMGAFYCASQLVGIVSGAVAGLPFLAYVVISVGLLWTRGAGAWFAARSSGASSGSKPPPIIW
jgi:hypothetical protein